MNSRTIQPSPLRLSQRKRQAILDAALQEFDSGGFDATSMDQIAARAEVSKRTVYNHFNSKEELFEAIRGELFSRIADIKFEYNPATCLRGQLEAIAVQQVQLLCSEAFVTFARISIPLSIRSDDLARATFQEFHASNQAIRRFIKAATQDGRLAVVDAAFAARQFAGLLNTGLLWPRILGGQPEATRTQKKQIVESTVSMFLKTYAVK